MNPYEKAKYSDLLTWLRRHRAIWSHIRVRFVALRFADRWNALWTQITMLDGESNDDLLGGPSCQFEDVLAANVVIPITALPRLLRSIRMGHLPAGAISDLSDLHFSWIDGQVPEPDDLRTELSPQYYQHRDMKSPASWPHAELLFRSTTMSDWYALDRPNRYHWLRGIDGRFRFTGFGTVAQLAIRLGLTDAGNSSSPEDARCSVRIIAPFRARIANVCHNRDTGCLRVSIERSRRIPHDRIHVVLAEPSNTKPPRSPVPLGKDENEVTFDRVSPGEVEVELFDRVLGSISLKKGIVRPLFSAFPRVVALECIDPGGAHLLDDLSSRDSDRHEQGVANLLDLLGYAPLRWDRDTPLPAHARDGRLPIDLMAFHPADRTVLIVECTTDWLGDDKLAKLVTRTNEIATAMRQRLADCTPPVMPLIVVAKPRETAPKALLASADKHGVGVLAEEDVSELVQLLRAGVTAKEVDLRFEGCFPHGGMRRYAATEHSRIEDWSGR
jgi:hypothetical protein